MKKYHLRIVFDECSTDLLTCIWLQIEKYLDSQQQNDAVSNQPDVKNEAAEDYSDGADEEEEVKEEVKCDMQIDSCIMSALAVPPSSSAIILEQ